MAKTRPCAFCREEIPDRTAVCPRCEEPQPVPATTGRDWKELLAGLCLGVASGLFALAVGLRLSDGPLADLASMAASLRFLEQAAAAGLLVLIALALGRR